MFELFGIMWGIEEMLMASALLGSLIGTILSIKKSIKDGSFKFKGLAESEIAKMRDEEQLFVQKAATLLRAVELKEEAHEVELKRLADKIEYTYGQIKELIKND